jgi:hypothetical protein
LSPQSLGCDNARSAVNGVLVRHQSFGVFRP